MSYLDQRDVRLKHGIAIINPYGGIWTDELFETPEAALDYLRRYWKNDFEPEKWKLAMATATITLNRSPGEPTLIPLPS